MLAGISVGILVPLVGQSFFLSLFLYLSRWDCAVQEITALTYLILTCTRPSASPTAEVDLVWVRLECKSDPGDHHMKICARCLRSENIQPCHFCLHLVVPILLQEGPPRSLPAKSPGGPHAVGQHQQLAGHHQRGALGLKRHSADLLGLHQGQCTS